MRDAHDISPNNIQKLTLLAIVIDKDKSDEFDICLGSFDDHTIKVSLLVTNKAFLYSLYS